MIANLGLLFLFGMTISSGHFMTRLNQPFEIAIIPRGQSNGCPSGPELAPLICKFMQQNIDFQYKPKLIAPTTYIPPLVVEKCDSPKLEMEIDLPVFIDEKKALVIPTPPELPPITIPKFPIPVIIEVPPASVDEPCKTADIPETPVVNIPIAPELPPFEMPALPQIIEQPEPQIQEKVNPEIEYNVVEYDRWVVPQAPKLPAFIMPEFPMMPIVVAPCPEDESFTEIPVPELVQPLATVPAAPELPPIKLPNFPVRVEIPAEPILLPVDNFSTPKLIEHPIEEPCLTEVVIPEIENNLVEYRPISVPQPPELPEFVMPELPEIVMKQELPIMAAPGLEDQPEPVITVPEHLEPMAPVPAAPELPAFVMPEFPVRMVELGLPAVPAPCPEDESIPELPTSAFIQPLAPIPAGPELPPALQLPEFPIRVEIPAGPILPPADIFTPSLFITQPIEEPCLDEAIIPEIDNNYVEYHPISVPQPPKLPAFVMPELPKIVVEQEPPVMAAPFLEDQPEPVITVPEHLEPIAPVPAAPELPAFVMPEFPVRMVELGLPAVPTPCPEDESIPELPTSAFIQPLAPLPAGPELPPALQLPEFPIRVEIPAGPILPPADIFTPSLFITQPIEEPCLDEAIIPEIDNNYVEYHPISVPQPPKLPAFVMPELPKIVVEQEPPVMAAPFLEDQPEPVITVPEHLEPMAPVPAAPELPAFVMPEFPVRMVELGLPAVPTPCPEDESIPELPTSAFIQPLAPIPAGPELPPALQLPEFPIRVEIPAGPILPPADIFTPSLFITQPIEEPCLDEAIIPEIDNNYVEYNPISVPQPPKLPAFVMPELPKIVVGQEPPVMAAPYLEDKPAPVVTIPEYIKPLAPVPAAPEFRLASLPEFPIHFEIHSGPVLMPNTEEPCLTEELVVPKPEPIIIPQPPKLPKLVMPELPKFEPVALPMPTFAAEPCESSGQPIFKVTAGPSPYFERYFPSSMEKLHKIMIPSQPIDPTFFPTRCVYDFVMQHVIPNIAFDRFRSMDGVKALPSPVLPCS